MKALIYIKDTILELIPGAILVAGVWILIFGFWAAFGE